MLVFRLFLLLTAATELLAESAVPGAAACIACRADFAQMRAVLSDEQWQAIEGGEVITSTVESKGEDGETEYLNEALAVIDRNPTQVWAVITDFASRKDYSPSCEEVRTVRREGNRLWLHEHVSVLLVDIRYQTVNDLDPERGAVVWKIDRGVANDIEDTHGSWQIAPLPDGNRTLVRYRLNVDPGKPVPRVIQDFLTGRSLPKMIGGMRAEIEKRHPQVAEIDRR